MMPNRKRDNGTNPAPHFDGKREGIINDPLGTQSTQMGVSMDTDQSKNPFHVTKLNNEEMKEFEQLTRGKKVED